MATIIRDGIEITLSPQDAAALHPTRALDQLKADKLTLLSDVRWQHETSGTVVGGSPVATDRQTGSILTAAYVVAKEDANYSIRYKVEQGVFVTLDAATIIGLATGVRLHVQACFDREDELTTAILGAADHAALEAIDINGGWPN